jgi:hypothetical protein
MTPIITVEPYTGLLHRSHDASWGITHSHPSPAVQYGELVICERAHGLITVLSTEADCPFGIDAAARAWAEATGAIYQERAA